MLAHINYEFVGKIRYQRLKNAVIAEWINIAVIQLKNFLLYFDISIKFEIKQKLQPLISLL